MDDVLSRNRNVNRGYRKLRVWLRAVDLYVLVVDNVQKMPHRPLKLMGQIMDAAQSVSSNIAEGYCRRSLKEYLNFLNIAMGSAGETYSRCYTCYRAGQLTRSDFDNMDLMHFEVENMLLKLIESLQKKQKEGGWQDSFFMREDDAEYFVQ